MKMIQLQPHHQQQQRKNSLPVFLLDSFFIIKFNDEFIARPRSIGLPLVCCCGKSYAHLQPQDLPEWPLSFYYDYNRYTIICIVYFVYTICNWLFFFTISKKTPYQFTHINFAIEGLHFYFINCFRIVAWFSRHPHNYIIFCIKSKELII